MLVQCESLKKLAEGVTWFMWPLKILKLLPLTKTVMGRNCGSRSSCLAPVSRLHLLQASSPFLLVIVEWKGQPEEFKRNLLLFSTLEPCVSGCLLQITTSSPILSCLAPSCIAQAISHLPFPGFDISNPET